ncbi:rcc01693 family protein [Cypionkella sp.]|jgi:uncharacterized phage protein (TIGR02216 family)|uniref:rcc01693 family protein n=1 Tax=Cypionkella sp. TaxID=2811411 RepID=UPI00272785B3|nr:rcc01693 family protein [Cypionkella sp.]MDO8983265.1 phage tail assembly chaperone [Cypionkella sp.]MDP2048532.1 phage tail assembly chaperone [Cypionkella sp.]
MKIAPTNGMDWPGLMRAGMGALRLTPAQFWVLSPIELRIMLGAEAALPPLTRARLEELAAAYPDFTKGAGDGDGRGVARPDSGA